MSKTFKICHINNESIKNTFVFNGNDDSETFREEKYGEEVTLVNEYIHLDDSIRRIKEKIFMHCDLNCSISEIYLFCVVDKVLDPEIIYNKLTQNDNLDLTNYRLEVFIKNLSRSALDFITSVNIDSIIKKRKEVYTYDEFVNLGYINWEELNKYIVPIGQKVIIGKSYEFISNPFNSIEDDYLSHDVINFTTIQNRNLLFEYGNIVNNTIYLCTAEDVLLHLRDEEVSDTYLLKLYFPELFIVHKINSLKELLRKKSDIIIQNNAFIEENRVSEYNSSVNLLYDIYTKRTSELEYLNIGIKNIFLTIHPTSKINLPLEILFKLVESSEVIPLVKYNPGTRQENIYRLFTSTNISENGKKIPTLYAENKYKKGKIIKLLSNIEKKRRVTYIVKQQVSGNEVILYVNFIENGNIEIQIDFNKNYQSIENVETLIRDSINENILFKINNFLEQSGYNYIYFNRINDENIEINDITYILNIKNNKKINLNNISKCVSSVFKMDKAKISKSSDLILLDYKRVSNFNVMNSIESYITIQRQKFNKSLNDIIDGLMVNFKLSKASAEEKVAEWSQNVQHEVDKYENKKVKILSSPGFRITMQNSKILEEGQFTPITNIEITNITGVEYIYFLKIFIDSLMRLVINKKSTNIPLKQINTMCKRGELKEISEEKQVNAKVEETLMESLNDADPIDIGIDNKLDNIIGAEEDDWSDSEDEDSMERSLDKVVSVERKVISETKKQKTPEDELLKVDDDDEVVMDYDLSNFSISGNNNIFLKRLRAHDKDLFLIDVKKGFQSYSKACPWQYKRYPVVLSDKDKKYIDAMDKELGVKSYDEHITYGSKEKKNHYICPRFWCFRDENGKQRSLSFEQVNRGECGGWNALIPHNAKKITKGKRIFEFTDTRMHKNGVDTDNKLVYRPMFPGYQKRNKHPDGLCVPCCFKMPQTTVGKDGHIWDRIKQGSKFVFKNRVTGETQSKAPENVYDFMYDSKPSLPTYNMDGNKIDVTSIKGKKLKRPLQKRSQFVNWSDCDQGKLLEEKSKVDVEEEQEKEEETTDSTGKIQISSDVPLLETFPLPKYKLGYLTIALQKFLNFNCKSVCQKSVNDTRLKSNTWCLMRLGIEKNKRQSFLGLIAFIYNIVNQKNISIEKMKKIILEMLTLEKFITLQNGNLITIFEPQDPESVTLENIDLTSVESVVTSELALKKVVGAYKNFIEFIKSKNEEINHIYMWDLLCGQNMLFSHGLNLVIVESPDDDITHKMQLICPTNIYSKEIFDVSKPTVLVYYSNGYYEPIIRYRLNGRAKDIMYLLNFNSLSKDAPEIVRIMRIIKENLLLGCSRKPSLPDVYNKQKDFYVNITSYEISKVISENGLNLEIVNQIVNNRMKVVGLLIKNDVDEIVYVPCYPSSINVTLPYVSLNSSELMQTYEKTVALLENIFNVSNRKILSQAKYKVVNDNKIVGIITITNQFVPVIPEDYQSPPMGWEDEKEPDGLLLFDANTKYYENFVENENLDKETEETNKERRLVVKKIKLESNFYNIFRNTLRIVLNSSETKEMRKQLINVVEDKRIPYYEKLEVIRDILNNILEDWVEFVDFDIENINEIIKCFGLSEESCKEKSCCSFSEASGKCKLLLPLKNMISEEDNRVYYFVKVADEILRYKKIRDFFFDKESFLQFEKVRYNLSDQEIILLEDLLINKYFENIKPQVSSNYVKNKRVYDMAAPNKSTPYSDKFNLSKVSKGKKTNMCILDKNEKPNFKMKVGEKWRRLHLGKWNKGQGEKFTFHRVNNTSECLWEFMAFLIEDNSGHKITRNELLNVLIREYEKYFQNGYENVIKKILLAEKKKTIVEGIKQGIALENILTFQNYWLSFLDFFIISLVFDLPIIFFASHVVPSIKVQSIVFGSMERQHSYLIKIDRMHTSNMFPHLGFLKHNGQIKVNHVHFEKAQPELFKNENLTVIEDYISLYLKNIKKTKKRGKIKIKGLSKKLKPPSK